jgi:hypothetical protein
VGPLSRPADNEGAVVKSIEKKSNVDLRIRNTSGEGARLRVRLATGEILDWIEVSTADFSKLVQDALAAEAPQKTIRNTPRTCGQATRTTSRSGPTRPCWMGGSTTFWSTIQRPAAPDRPQGQQHDPEDPRPLPDLGTPADRDGDKLQKILEILDCTNGTQEGFTMARFGIEG